MGNIQAARSKIAKIIEIVVSVILLLLALTLIQNEERLKTGSYDSSKVEKQHTHFLEEMGSIIGDNHKSAN